MERAVSVEERIRRAEEIYQRRKQGEARPVAKVTVNNNKKDIKLLKKMVIQILICVAIYFVVYTIQNGKYVFSEDFMNRTNEILSYDTNFVELYERAKAQIMQWMSHNGGNGENNEAIGGAEEKHDETLKGETTQDDSNEEQTTLSQEEADIQNVKNTTTFIKPIEGVISSSYGHREPTTNSVPKNHTGTDIAAPIGTKIRAATDGEVVISSEEGDYRKTSKNSDRRSQCGLCTLQSVVCKPRR